MTAREADMQQLLDPNARQQVPLITVGGSMHMNELVRLVKDAETVGNAP